MRSASSFLSTIPPEGGNYRSARAQRFLPESRAVPPPARDGGGYWVPDLKSSRFAVPEGIPLSRLSDAALTMVFLTVAGEAKPLCRMRAATPATCGAAIDVPLIVAVAVLLVDHAEVMLEPGAKMSTTLPKFENDDRASVLVLDPTVIASATRAGEELLAFVIRVARRNRIRHAVGDRVAHRGVERRRHAAAKAHVRDRRVPAAWFDVTKFTPAMTPEFDPDPEQLRTRTATSRTALATP